MPEGIRRAERWRRNCPEEDRAGLPSRRTCPDEFGRPADRDAKERSPRGAPQDLGRPASEPRRNHPWMLDRPVSDANPERAACDIPRTIAPAMSASELGKVRAKSGPPMSANRVRQA